VRRPDAQRLERQQLGERLLPVLAGRQDVVALADAVVRRRGLDRLGELGGLGRGAGLGRWGGRGTGRCEQCAGGGEHDAGRAEFQ
jgi:hypothetical protein